MNADAVKARLKNFAEKSGCTFQEALTYYGMERILYRISISPYAEHFVLKGGVLLYAIFDRQYERAKHEPLESFHNTLGIIQSFLISTELPSIRTAFTLRSKILTLNYSPFSQVIWNRKPH